MAVTARAIGVVMACCSVFNAGMTPSTATGVSIGAEGILVSLSDVAGGVAGPPVHVAAVAATLGIVVATKAQIAAHAGVCIAVTSFAVGVYRTAGLPVRK